MSVGRRSGPPPRWERLLERVLPPGMARDTVPGDLAEEHADIVGRRGRSVADLWYRLEVVRLAVRFGWAGMRRRNHGGEGTMTRGFTGDLRWAVRSLRRSPGFTAVVVVTLALGIGANALIFSAVWPVLARPLPFPDPDRLVRPWERVEGGALRNSASWHNVVDWREASSRIDLAVYNPRDGNLRVGSGASDRPERIGYALVEPGVLEILATPPFLGRILNSDDAAAGADGVAVVSHRLWRRQLGADPDAVGTTLRLGGQTLEVVGVMPPGFGFPDGQTDLWKPFGMTPSEGGDRGSRWVQAIGRVAPGETRASAERELQAVARRLAEAYPDANAGWSIWLEPLDEFAVAGVRTRVYALWAAVALLLLVACGNVATLLLARTRTRRREMAVRAALGAGHGRLLRQLLAEGALLAAAGTGLGVVLALPALDGVSTWLDGRLGAGLQTGAEGTVAAYAVALGGVVALLLTALPALHLVGSGAVAPSTLREGGRGATGGRRPLADLLVVGQTALAVLALVGAGLALRTVVSLQAVEVGFEVEDRVAFRVAPSQTEIPERTGAARTFARIAEELSALPGVSGVAAVNELPLSGSRWNAAWAVEGRSLTDPTDRIAASQRVVTPGYFEVAGIPVLRGRALRSSDEAGGEPVAVVSRSFADRLAPGGDAIGMRVNFAPEYEQVSWVRIVGIVGDVPSSGLQAEPSPLLYRPFEQAVWGHFGDWGMDWIVRLRGAPDGLRPAVLQAVSRGAPGLPVYAFTDLESYLASRMSDERLTAALLGLFGTLTLLLSSVGVFAVLAHAVTRREREIGVRRALGAPSRAILSGVVARGLGLAGAGALAGLVLALVASRWMESLLFGVGARDPLTFAAAPLILVGVATLASLAPAWRAATVDPATPLRSE